MSSGGLILAGGGLMSSSAMTGLNPRAQAFDPHEEPEGAMFEQRKTQNQGASKIYVIPMAGSRQSSTNPSNAQMHAAAAVASIDDSSTTPSPVPSERRDLLSASPFGRSQRSNSTASLASLASGLSLESGGGLRKKKKGKRERERLKKKQQALEEAEAHAAAAGSGGNVERNLNHAAATPSPSASDCDGPALNSISIGPAGTTNFSPSSTTSSNGNSTTRLPSLNMAAPMPLAGMANRWQAANEAVGLSPSNRQQQRSIQEDDTTLYDTSWDGRSPVNHTHSSNGGTGEQEEYEGLLIHESDDPLQTDRSPKPPRHPPASRNSTGMPVAIAASGVAVLSASSSMPLLMPNVPSPSHGGTAAVTISSPTSASTTATTSPHPPQAPPPTYRTPSRASTRPSSASHVIAPGNDVPSLGTSPSSVTAVPSNVPAPSLSPIIIPVQQAVPVIRGPLKSYQSQSIAAVSQQLHPDGTSEPSAPSSPLSTSRSLSPSGQRDMEDSVSVSFPALSPYSSFSSRSTGGVASGRNHHHLRSVSSNSLSSRATGAATLGHHGHSTGQFGGGNMAADDGYRTQSPTPNSQNSNLHATPSSRRNNQSTTAATRKPLASTVSTERNTPASSAHNSASSHSGSPHQTTTHSSRGGSSGAGATTAKTAAVPTTNNAAHAALASLSTPPKPTNGSSTVSPNTNSSHHGTPSSSLNETRKAIVAYISSPGCNLFSQVAGFFQVTHAHLDTLVSVGRGLPQLLSRLRKFDRGGLVFQSMEHLIETVGVTEARSVSKRRKMLLAYLSSAACTLFSTTAELKLTVGDLDSVVEAAGGSVTQLLEYLQRLDHAGAKFTTLKQIQPVLTVLSERDQQLQFAQQLHAKMQQSQQQQQQSATAAAQVQQQQQQAAVASLSTGNPQQQLQQLLLQQQQLQAQISMLQHQQQQQQPTYMLSSQYDMTAALLQQQQQQQQTSYLQSMHLSTGAAADVNAALQSYMYQTAMQQQPLTPMTPNDVTQMLMYQTAQQQQQQLQQ